MNKKINNFLATKLQKSVRKLLDEQRVNTWVNILIPDEWLRVDINVETHKSEYSFTFPSEKFVFQRIPLYFIKWIYSLGDI